MRLLKLASTLTLLSTIALGASLSGGCADNLATVYVDHVIGYDSENYECVIEPAFDGPGLTTGRYDYFAGNPYYVRLVVGNQLVPQGDNDLLRAETSRIAIQGAVINTYDGSGNSVLASFTSRASGTIQPDDSEDPGLSAFGIPIIQTQPVLPVGNYQIGIEVFGETLGGTNVESGEFLFPVEILPYGYYSSCDSNDTLFENEDRNPCGVLSQDGGLVSCNDRPDEVCDRCINP